MQNFEPAKLAVLICLSSLSLLYFTNRGTGTDWVMRRGDDVTGCAQTYGKRLTVRTRHVCSYIVRISYINVEGKMCHVWRHNKSTHNFSMESE